MGNPGRKPKVTDEELLEVFRSSDQPVMTPQQVADEVTLTRRSVHNRLVSLEKQGILERMDVGPTGSVWWIDDAKDQSD